MNRMQSLIPHCSRVSSVTHVSKYNARGSSRDSTGEKERVRDVMAADSNKSYAIQSISCLLEREWGWISRLVLESDAGGEVSRSLHVPTLLVSLHGKGSNICINFTLLKDYVISLIQI